MKKRVVIGLGNPGRQYQNTRHNIGFMAACHLAGRAGISLREAKMCKAMAGKGAYCDTDLHIVLPMTYMNCSGVAAAAYLSYYGLAVEDLLVLVDDVNLPFGQLRFREKGGAGGHNGLKHIEERLASPAYPRLRIGVGKDDRVPMENYVLMCFPKEEEKILPQVLANAADAVETVLAHSIDDAMTAINQKMKET